jgi:hypothetical protein
LGKKCIKGDVMINCHFPGFDALFVLAIAVTISLISFSAKAGEQESYEQYLRASAVPKSLIDRFLQGPSWAQFDPQLGYILGNYLPADGLDGSTTLSTVQANGARTSFVYADRPCRINTY